MPSIIPSYVYSLFAALLVGSIIVYSCSLSALSIKNEAATQQLRNVGSYVVAQSLTLITQTSQNQNTTQFLNVPSSIGNQRYWIQIANDSSGAWVESGFGTAVTSSQIHFDIPVSVTASGIFICGSARPLLQCHFEGGTPVLTLTSENL